MVNNDEKRGVELLPEKYYTTNEASGFLKLAPRTVTRYIIHKQLIASKDGRDYKILGTEILRYIKDRRTPGRPAKNIIGLEDAPRDKDKGRV